MRVEKNDYRAHQAKPNVDCQPLLCAAEQYLRSHDVAALALRLSEEVADLSTQAKLVNGMAIAYLFHNEYQIALGYQERCDRLMTPDWRTAVWQFHSSTGRSVTVS